MNLNESLQCVRPVIFENDDSEYPDSVECSSYWMQGTCFLIGHQQTTFVVTARHVLTNQVSEGSDATFLHNQLRVRYGEGSRDFIPLDTCLQIVGNDESYKDLMVFRVASGILDQTQQLNMTVPQVDNLKLAMETPLPIRPNAPLVTRGYPAQFNYIDFEHLRIRLRVTDLKGRLTGYKGNQHLFRMSWDPDNVSRIEKYCEEACEFDPNGMSGSPVFEVERGCLVGVLVMGSKTIGHFIDARFIYRIISDFLRGKAENAV